MLDECISVYAILCTVNNWVYVGASNDLDWRFREHLKGNGNTKLYQDVVLYGESAFTLVLLDTCREDCVAQKELEWLEQYSETHNVYNERKAGYQFTIESKRKISNSRMGIALSDTHKKRISLVQLGDKGVWYGAFGKAHPHFGCKHSEDTKRKISESSKRCNKDYSHLTSPEMKKMLSEKMTGEKNPNFGKKFSDETRKRMSEARRRRTHNVK